MPEVAGVDYGGGHPELAFGGDFLMDDAGVDAEVGSGPAGEGVFA